MPPNPRSFASIAASLLTVGLLILMVSCKSSTSAKGTGGGSSTGSTGSTGGSSGGSGNYTSCRTEVIDQGQKGVVAANARGTYSDVKMVPGTSIPATAYLDQSTLTIKLSYFNGSQFVTEVVSGEGTGAWVRLVFTSDGRPFVFWTLGTAVKVAIRNDSLLSSGSPSWSAGVIDNGNVAPRALEAAVNPEGQIMLSYVTDTATTGRTKFAYCDIGCSAPSSFQIMTSNPYVDNTAIVAAVTATGAAWCKASSNQYYPMVSYSVTGNTKVAICQNSLPNCLNGANWITGVVVAAGNVSSKLYLDPNITGDVPKVATYNGANLLTYVMGTTSCASTPVAFTASAALGNYGSQWISFMKDPTNNFFHLMANSGAASTVYLNNGSINPTLSWNAAGTVDSSAIPAATAGGATVDGANQTIYASYAINAANYDLKLAEVGNYTTASNGGTQQFNSYVPDQTGMIQFSPTVGTQQKNIAVASTPSGIPGVAYVDYSAGAVTTGRLKFALRTGSSSTSAWEYFTLPGIGQPQFPSLAFDNNNRPWIGYFDASVNRFYLATNTLSDGAGTWTTYQFPAIPIGAPGALPRANNTAVAMYYNAGVAYPVLIVLDNNVTSIGAKAATLNPNNRVFGSVTTIDPLGANGAAHLSTDFDTNGNVVLAFQDLTATQVKYAYMSGTNSWSATLATSVAGRGEGISIRINPATGRPAMTYHDNVNNFVYYSACSNSIAGCVSGGWTSTPIETLSGLSGITAATGQLLATALNFDSSGNAYVLYPRGVGNDGNLILNTNLTGSFAPAVLVPGVNAAISGSPALNFAISGWNVASARNSSGGYTGVYIGPGDWLYSVSCGD